MLRPGCSGRSVCRSTTRFSLFGVFFFSLRHSKNSGLRVATESVHRCIFLEIRCPSPSNIIMCLSTCSVDSVTQTACCGCMTKRKTKFTGAANITGERERLLLLQRNRWQKDCRHRVEVFKKDRCGWMCRDSTSIEPRNTDN